MNNNSSRLCKFAYQNSTLFKMQTVVLHGKSKTDLKLLTDLARKIGISVKYLTEEEKEEIGLLNAIKKGRTGTYVNSDTFIKKLRK